MKKIYLFTWMLLFMGSISFAQNTVVSATVTDSDSTVWAGGNWKIQFVPNAANQNLSQYNQNGIFLLTTIMNQNGTMDTSGHFSVTVYDSSTITPIGSSWKLTVCPLATAPCGVYNFSTAGPTQNIGSALTFIIPAPRFTAVQGTYGYNDVEAIPTLVPGSTYYSNTLQCQRYYNNNTATWACPSATTGFLPLSGGTLSGGLFGTTLGLSGNFNGNLAFVNQISNSAIISPDTTDTILANSSGQSVLQTAQNSFYDVVKHWGLDNTGVSDVSSALQTKINTICALNTPAYIFFPAGTYNLGGTGLSINATISTCNGIQLISAGRDSTIIESTCSVNPWIIKYSNTTNSGDNWLGQRFTDFTLRDISNSGNQPSSCDQGLYIVQGANISIDRVKTWGFAGKLYATGTITIAGNVVTGVGTTFTSEMVQGTLQVTQGGVAYRAKICTFTNGTTMGLCSTSFNTGDIAIGTAYAISYGGQGLAIAGGFSYSQYISIRDYYGYGDLECMAFWGATTGGNSRISVEGKNGGCDGLRVPNSIGWSIARRTDTIHIAGRVNNVSLCGFSESAHANVWDGSECEMNNTYTVVTTCNGGVATQSCNEAWETTSDLNGDGWGNVWITPYAYLVGTVYQFDNATGAFDSAIIADRTLSGTYLTHYNFSGFTGCPGNGSGIKSLISNIDCNHQIVAQTVN